MTREEFIKEVLLKHYSNNEVEGQKLTEECALLLILNEQNGCDVYFSDEKTDFIAKKVLSKKSLDYFCDMFNHIKEEMENKQIPAKILFER